MTASMFIAMRDLKLDALYVVYPGQRRYTLTPSDGTPAGMPVEAVPLANLASACAPIGADPFPRSARSAFCNVMLHRDGLAIQ